jgi:glucose/mannose transport system permease protein
MKNTLSPRPRQACFTPARLGVYFFLISAALFFLLPLYVMGITSIKPMSEIRLGNIFAVSAAGDLRALGQGLVFGLHRVGMQGHLSGLLEFDTDPHSLAGAVDPLGSINGYALAYWRVKWAGWFFGILMLGAFIPYPVMLYPLVRMFARSICSSRSPTSC